MFNWDPYHSIDVGMWSFCGGGQLGRFYGIYIYIYILYISLITESLLLCTSAYIGFLYFWMPVAICACMTDCLLLRIPTYKYICTFRLNLFGCELLLLSMHISVWYVWYVVCVCLVLGMSAGCFDAQHHKAIFHSTSLKFVCLLLSYAIATVFQLYLSIDMIHEMKRRKPKPIVFYRLIGSLTSHAIYAWCELEELASDDTVKLYTVGKWIATQPNAIAITGIRTTIPRATYISL